MNAGPVAEYLAALESELQYDRALARRICAEVQDHLAEASAFSSEDEAVERFGAPRDFAAQLATVSFSNQTRATASAAIMIVVAMFVLMRIRAVWYGAVHLHAAQGLPVLVDRYAFWLAVGGAVAALTYGAAAKMIGPERALDRARLERAFIFSVITTACALILLATDALITLAKLASTLPSPSATVPALVFICEAVLVAVLVRHVQQVLRSHRRLV